MPLLFHGASYHGILFASTSDLRLLFFVPFLFQLYVSTRGRVVNCVVALVFVVICLENRVVLHSFGKYIQVHRL